MTGYRTVIGNLEAAGWLAGWRAAVLVSLVLLPIFGASANFTQPRSIDTVTTSLSAWSLGTRSSLDVGDVEGVFDDTVAVGQSVEVDGRLYTNRFPGTIIMTAPIYALVSDSTPPPPLWPGTVAAVIIATAAMVALRTVLSRLVDGPQAFVATIAFALGTATWSVSSDALWTHGPSQLWLLIGLSATSLSRPAASGLAYGAAILTRPHLAAVPLVSGIHAWAHDRDWRALARIGGASAVGLAAWLLYGRLVFGQWSLLGSYATSSLDDRIASQTLSGWIVNIWWMLVHPLRGLFWYSPMVLPLLIGVRKAWREAPEWVRAGALGGVTYLCVQAYINRWSGGDGYWGYRYPIETLTLTAPLLLMAYGKLRARHQRWAHVLVGLSIFVQGLGAVVARISPVVLQP